MEKWELLSLKIVIKLGGFSVTLQGEIILWRQTFILVIASQFAAISVCITIVPTFIIIKRTKTTGRTGPVLQKLRQFCWMGGFCPLVELHREGSAPAACAAGLFIKSVSLSLPQLYDHFTEGVGFAYFLGGTVKSSAMHIALLCLHFYLKSEQTHRRQTDRQAHIWVKRTRVDIM